MDGGSNPEVRGIGASPWSVPRGTHRSERGCRRLLGWKRTTTLPRMSVPRSVRLRTVLSQTCADPIAVRGAGRCRSRRTEPSTSGSAGLLSCRLSEQALRNPQRISEGRGWTRERSIRAKSARRGCPAAWQDSSWGGGHRLPRSASPRDGCSPRATRWLVRQPRGTRGWGSREGSGSHLGECEPRTRCCSGSSLPL